MRISDWSSDVCSSDLADRAGKPLRAQPERPRRDADAESDGAAPAPHRMAATPDRRARPPRRAPDRQDRRPAGARSEEHTSELQSLMRISYAVFCLKKKQQP